MNLASGWLAYYNLCWSDFCHIAYKIRLRSLRPCKILTSTLMFSCSFDVTSLFTYVPLDETIKICSEALCDQSNSQPVIPKNVFVELMESATSSVEFSFNNTMYKQRDGVTMGLLLGQDLANIFVGYYEKNYFLKRRSLQHTSAMLTTRLPFSITKLKQMNF